MASPDTSAPPPLVPVLVVLLLAGVLAVLAWPTPDGGDRTPEASSSSQTAAARSASSIRLEADAAGVLRAWDRERADAWADGDTGALAALYVAGTSVGRADLAMLEDWTARGLHVQRLTTQLLDVQVLAHSRRRWVLRVRDRVIGGVATGPGLRQALPEGGVREREVVLRRVRGAWRVASVRPPRRVPGQP